MELHRHKILKQPRLSQQTLPSLHPKLLLVFQRRHQLILKQVVPRAVHQISLNLVQQQGFQQIQHRQLLLQN
jgi:hypothetical protein